MRTVSLLVLVLVAACGSKSPAPRTATSAGTSDLDAGAPARTCRSNADCGTGEICWGPEGCDIPWTCVANRPCTQDMRIYCGCDGQRHDGSGTCPPAPYKHAGECP